MSYSKCFSNNINSLYEKLDGMSDFADISEILTISDEIDILISTQE